MTLSQEVIEDIIEIGERGLPSVPDSLSDSSVAWTTLMCGTAPWRAVGCRLGEDELRFLIAGLILFAKASGWSGGSVSPTITLYDYFRVRFSDAEPRLTEWIVRNRTNPYEPFGTVYFNDATSYSEHVRSRIAERRKKEERQAAAEIDRLQRRAAAATAKLSNAVRRGDLNAVTALVARGANWRDTRLKGMSMLELAENEGRNAVYDYLRQLTEAAGD